MRHRSIIVVLKRNAAFVALLLAAILGLIFKSLMPDLVWNRLNGYGKYVVMIMVLSIAMLFYRLLQR